jgi:hypothetical protein
LKFWKSTGTPTPNMGVHFGSVGVYSHTLPHSRASLLAHTFANPCLGREPKARVATVCFNDNGIGNDYSKHNECWKGNG